MYYTTLTPLSTIKTSKKKSAFCNLCKKHGNKKASRVLRLMCKCTMMLLYYYYNMMLPSTRDNISHHVSSRWLLFCCYPSVLLGIDVYFLMQQTANQAGFVGQPRIPFSGIIVLLYRPSALLPLDEKRDPFYDDLLYQKLSACCPLFRSHKFIITINNKILQNR